MQSRIIMHTIAFIMQRHLAYSEEPRIVFAVLTFAQHLKYMNQSGVLKL